MHDLEQQNAALKSEADIILHDLGLLDLLGWHGIPTPTGSYSAGLMTWPDLDLYLACESPDTAAFFDLGKEIAAGLRPQKMTFDNNLDNRIGYLPRGLYWGIRTCHDLPQLWKIDLWCIDPLEAEELLAFQRDLFSRITPDNRRAILAIKNDFCSHPEYRRGFCSVDIYNAVLDRGARTTDDFAEILREKGIDTK